MLSSRSVIVTKKAISLSITILFTINSLSFAQMPSRDALRERSTALSSSADIVDSLKHVDISSLTAQEIRERIPAYELLMKKAATRASGAPFYDQVLWQKHEDAEAKYQNAMQALVAAEQAESSAKSSSSGTLSNKPVIDMSQIKADVTLTSARKRAAFLAAKNAPEYDDDLWDDYFKAESNYFTAVSRFLEAEESITFSAKSPSTSTMGPEQYIGKRILSKDVSQLDLQELSRRVYVLEVKKYAAQLKFEEAAGFDYELWYEQDIARRAYQYALKQFSDAQEIISEAKSSSSGDKGSSKPGLAELKEKSKEVYLAILNSSKYDPELWDAYWKADREYFDVVKELFDVSGITSFAKSSSSGIPVEVKVEKVPAMFKSLEMTPQEEEAMLLIYETGLYTPYAYGRCSVALRLLLLAGMHEDPLAPYKKAVVSFLKDKMDDLDKSYNGEDKLFLAFGLAVLGSNYKEIVSGYKDNIRSTLNTYRTSENIYYNMLSNTGLAILDGNLTSDYIADILPKLDDALKKDDQDGRLLPAVIIAALGSVDEVILKTRRRDLIRVFKHFQYNSSKHDHLLSVIGLVAQSNKDSVSLFIKDSIANYDIDSEGQGNLDSDIMLLLVGNSKDDKLLLALGLTVLGENNKEILAEHEDMIRSILESYQNSAHVQYKILSNIGLRMLDGNLTFDYIEGMLPELEDDFENGDADSKLLLAVAIAILSRTQDAIYSKYRDRILPILKAALTNTGDYSNFSTRPDNGNHANQGYVYLLSVIGLTALSEEVESLYRITIEYPGTQKTDTILGKDAYELADSLTQTIPKELGISFTALSDKNLSLSLTGDLIIDGTELGSLIPSGPMIANIDQEGMLGTVLEYTIDSAVDSIKSSSAGNVISKVGKGPELLKYLNSKEYQATIRELEYKLNFPQLDYRVLSAMQMALLFRIDNSLFLKNRERILSVLEEGIGDKDLYIQLLSMAGLASLSSLDADILLENKDDILSILETGMHSGISHYKLISAIGLLLLFDVDKNTSDKYFKMASAILEKNLKGSGPSNRQLVEMVSLVITGKDAPYAAGTDASFNDKMPELRLKDRDFSPPAGLPKFSSAGFNSRDVIKLEAINIDELMTLLTGEEGIKSTDPLVIADAVDLISEFDKEEIERYIEIDEITNVLASSLKSTNPWTRAYAVAKLSGLDKDIIESYIKDAIDFLRSNKAFGSSVQKTQLRAAAILSKFDRDLLGSYMNPDGIVQFLAGEKGFENSDPSTREYAAELLSGFGKDMIAPYIDIKRATTSLVNYLEGSADLWRKARATSALQQLLGKDSFPAIFKLVLTGPDYEEPLTSFVKDAYKLRDILNQSVSPIMGSSFIAVSDDSIRLLPHTKSFSAGDLSVDDLEDRVTFLVGEGGLGSADERTRAFAAEYLLELPEKGYTSHIDKIVAVLKDGFTNIDPVVRSDAAQHLARLDVGTLSEHGLDPLKVISALPFDMPIAPVGPTVSLSKSSSSGISLTPEDIENIKLALAAANSSNAIGTIVYDDTKLSDERQQKLQNLIGAGKDSLLTDLEAKLGGCKVRLMSQGGIEDNANTIIISTEQLSGFKEVKFFIVEQASQDMARDMSYAKIVPLIAIAKGLLGLENINEHYDLYLALKAAIKSLSRGQLNDSAIEAAITAYITDKLIFIMLPLPTSYDYDNLEQLQRQALMVLIAA